MNKNRALLSTHCGSYVYTAPEVMNGEDYDGFKADIWSIGKVDRFHIIPYNFSADFGAVHSYEILYITRSDKINLGPI